MVTTDAVIRVPRFRFETHLAILERPGMERHGAIGEECLDFCYKQITLFEEISHLKLIALQFATLKIGTVPAWSAHKDEAIF